MAPARAAGPGHERHHEINPAYVIAHDDLWETLLAPEGGINPAVAYRQSQCGPLGNTILIRIYGQGYISTGFVVIGVAASYLRGARFIEEARRLPSMTLWLLTVPVPLQFVLRPGAGTPPPLRSSADCGPIARLPQTSDNAALAGKLVSEAAPIFDLVIAGAGASGPGAGGRGQAGDGGRRLDRPRRSGLRRRQRTRRGCARLRSPTGRAACSSASAPGRRSNRTRKRSSRWRSWTGGRATPSAPRTSISKPKAAVRSPIWRSTTMSSGRWRRSATGSRSSALQASVVHWSPGKRVAALGLSDGRSLRARLAVAADGARSKLAALAGVATVGWDYDQAGIVATIAHERDHEGRAEQHFLPAGPFAILPLPGRRSSIVWNEAARRRPRAARPRPRGPHARARISLHAQIGRDPPRFARRGLSVPLPGRAAIRRRSAGARRRRGARRPSARRARSEPGLARRGGARRDDRRRDAARPRSRRAWAALRPTSAAGASTSRRADSASTRSIACSPTTSRLFASSAISAFASSIAPRRSRTC